MQDLCAWKRRGLTFSPHFQPGKKESLGAGLRSPNSMCGCAQTCPCLPKLLLCSFCSGTFQFGAGRHRGKVVECVLKTLHVAEPRLLLTQVLGLIVFESSQPWPCLHLEAT